MLEALRNHLRDRYQVEGELGRGGMATVFAASDLRHRRRVAIKVLLPEVASALGVDRFLREIETTAQFSHPHIVPVFDSGVIELGDGRRSPYFVMPLIEGASLRDRLKSKAEVPLAEAVSIIRDVGSALAYAHGHGVLHRDVKPENILLSSGEALLTDFGIAKPLGPDGSENLTATGYILGTPAYMSPEQRAGDPALDGRSDEYALAAVLYEMLAGELPFAGPTPRAIASRQMAGELRSLHTVRPSVPEAIDAAVRQALAPAPADRYPSVEAFVAGLAPSAPVRQRQPTLGWKPLTVGAVAIGASVLLLWLANRPAATDDPRLGVALMPFRTTGPAADIWAEALPDLLATTLSDTPGLRVPDPWSLWRGLRLNRADRARSPDPAEAERLAKSVGARRFVLGSLVESGDRLELNLRIYQAGSVDPLQAFTLSEASDSAVALARRTAVELISRLSPADVSAGAAGAPPTAIPDALKAYLAAREAMRRGLVDSADAAITRSIGLDSTFALAMLEAITIRTWVQSTHGRPFSGLRELVQRITARVGTLSERQRLRLAANEASIDTDGPATAAAWRRLIELDPTDVEAWNGLAHAHLVYGWQFGGSEGDLIRISDRALALDSTYVPALVRRAQLSPTLGDTADTREQIERLQAAEGSSLVLRGLRGGLQALLATDDEFPATVDRLATRPAVELVSVVRQLIAYRPDRALTFVRRLKSVAAPGFDFNLAANVEASLLAAVGRFAEVDSLRAAGDYRSVPFLAEAIDWRTLAHAMIGLEDSATTQGALARTAEATPRDSAIAWTSTARPVWLTSWLLAGYHATLGDSGVAKAWLATMAGFPRRGSPLEWAAAERADVEGRLASRAGRTDSQVPAIEQAMRLWTVHTENSRDFDPEPTFRFRLAESLRDRGLVDSAAAIFRSLVPPSTWLAGITTRSLFELGLIEEGKGNRPRALRYFDHALQFWELGGPEVAKWAELAGDGVGRVVTEGRVTGSGGMFRR